MSGDGISRIADYRPARKPGDIIEHDGTPEGIGRALSDALTADDERSFNPDRPYNGQPHTDYGERGKQMVSGLTMRDIADCFAIGLMLASGPGDPYHKASSGTARVRDLYAVDLGQIDPMAAIQNTTCEIEKRMGIFPNVPPLRAEQEPPHE